MDSDGRITGPGDTNVAQRISNIVENPYASFTETISVLQASPTSIETTIIPVEAPTSTLEIVPLADSMTASVGNPKTSSETTIAMAETPTTTAQAHDTPTTTMKVSTQTLINTSNSASPVVATGAPGTAAESPFQTLGPSTNAKIALGIVIPSLIIILLSGLFFWWRRRGQRRTTNIESQSILGSKVHNTFNNSTDTSLVSTEYYPAMTTKEFTARGSRRSI